MSSGNIHILITIALSLVLPASGLRADDPAVHRIVNQWAKAPGIHSGRVKCLHLTLHSHTPDELIRAIGDPEPTAREQEQEDAALERSLSPEDFGKFFDDVLLDLVLRVDSLEVMHENVTAWMSKTGRKNGEQIDFTCSQLTVIKDGSQLKNDEQYLGNRAIRSQRGNRFASYDADLKTAELSGEEGPVAQAEDGLTSVQPWIFTFEELRYWGASNAELAKQLNQMNLVTTVGVKESRLVGPQSEITFDTASGFVQRVTGLDAAGGSLVSELRYAVPRRAGGGVDLATVYANVNYRKTKKGDVRLMSADAYVVESAELNVKIAPGEFAVPVPGGTLIREGGFFSDSPLPPREFTSLKDVPDLMTVVLPDAK